MEINCCFRMLNEIVKTAYKRYKKICWSSSKINYRVDCVEFFSVTFVLILRKLSETLQAVLNLIVTPSKDWVRRFLMKNGYQTVKLAKKPIISEINRIKRIEFAKKYLEKGP